MPPHDEHQPLLANRTFDSDEEEADFDSTEKVHIIGVDDADSEDWTKTPPFSWKKLWLFTGPGFLMSIAFLDPGNLEGDLQAGAIAGYSLLWLLFWATAMGLLIQLLSARLGVATGRHLAELCRDEYPKWARLLLWVMAELALIGSDIQEVIGSAIAIKILSNGAVPLWGGVVITASDCFVFLFLENFGVRKLEAVFAVLIATMAMSFAWMFVDTKPNGVELLLGILIPKLSSKTIQQAVGVVGCIIMPHNVFLHSALVQSREIDRRKIGRVQEAFNYYSIESTVALVISFIINLFVTTVFAAAFYGTDIASSIGLANAGQYLEEKYGGGLLPILYIWAIGLLAAGQSSTLTGTYAGQFIMGGFLNLRLKKWVRALITRSFAIVPTMIVALAFESSDDSLDVLNEWLNVLQSVQIPFALIPLLCLVSNEEIMGVFKIGTALKMVSWLVAALLMLINGYLLLEFFSSENLGFSSLSSTPERLFAHFELIPTVCITMADKDQVVGIDATISLIEQLGKAFLELKAHKDAAEDNVQWSEIEEYFQHLETMMKKKIEELALREKDFKEKESETCTLLAEREAAVAAKEQDLLDRIQELKDAAVAAIAEARAKHEPEPLEPIDGGDGKETKVSSSLGDTNALLDVPEENSPNKTGENAEGVAAEVKPRAELTQFCEQMDAKGLLNYTMEHQKNISTIRVELSVALESATEPGHLVLASLEGFYPPDDTTTQEGDKRDAALRGLHLSCIMFMEAMATLLARADPGADHLLNPEIKQQAKAIADEWKPKLAGAAGTDAANAKNSLEAEAFLQLLATFSIASEFDEEELCKHVLAVAHKRRAPELCRSLGLAHKMPGVVEALVNSGRQIDAVHFIHAFELTERFPAVPLLKTYLKDLRRNSQGKPSNSGGAAGAQNDANSQELAALRAVIRCVKEYKLGADYPLDPLQKRVTQLERSKPDKKRSGESGKHQQFKKPRNGGFHGFRSPASAPVPAPTGGGGRQGAPAVFAERAMYAAGIAERYPPHAVPSTYDYQTLSQPTYAQQPPYDQRSYYYTKDDRVSAASTYNAAPPSYGSYVGSGMQSPHQQYM
ncbi:Metal transporter Nramp3 [Camellia lanceoleosa]|uniref:Metal transporter Nramp3 n=1 Tax=Camellia lanceoleosa TaxID=1840588 RepID=A0ACC0ITE7_9ERIC|nr:Metal transporter Nramp3 [Camellia lanceoleosa]